VLPIIREKEAELDAGSPALTGCREFAHALPAAEARRFRRRHRLDGR
jgi:hypothetical protein